MSTTVKKEHKSNRPARGGVVTFVEAIRQGLWEEMERDPLDRYHRHLLSKGVATPEKLDEIVADVRREIEEDSAWAESSPMPDPEKAAYNVFDNTNVPPAFRPKVLEN